MSVLPTFSGILMAEDETDLQRSDKKIFRLKPDILLPALTALQRSPDQDCIYKARPSERRKRMASVLFLLSKKIKDTHPYMTRSTYGQDKTVRSLTFN